MFLERSIINLVLKWVGDQFKDYTVYFGTIIILDFHNTWEYLRIQVIDGFT